MEAAAGDGSSAGVREPVADVVVVAVVLKKADNFRFACHEMSFDRSCY